VAVVPDSLDFTCEVDGGAAGTGSGQEKAPRREISPVFSWDSRCAAA
jgi:hypothetical protein